MSLSSSVLTLVLGALAGWLAGRLTRGRGYGILGNLIVGIVGAIIAQFLLGLLGFAPRSPLAQGLIIFAGAFLLAQLLRLVKS